jgi:oligo-1,6-glucosidase
MEQKTWWKEGIVYQIYPRSFMDSNGDGIGDLNGITEKLDYIKELGATIIWISPFYKSPNHDNGYDISDYTAIQQDFGTINDFDNLLVQAHARGLKIMIDLVVNHTSTEHPWFIESSKSRNNPYSDFYIWRDGKDGRPPNNWGSEFSGSAWQYVRERDQYYLHLFTPEQADLNWENEAVRNEVFKIMTWWCDKGIDGFRLDVINMISKEPGLPEGIKQEGALFGDRNAYVCNGPKVHDYLREMNRKVLSRYNLVTVGETPCVTVDEAVKYTGSDEGELNMVFQFEAMQCDSVNGNKWTDKRFSLPELKKIYAKWQSGLEGKGWNSLYMENHDQPRCIGRYADDKKFRVLSAKMLATCLHLQKGTPYVYEGEELGMTNTHFDTIDELKDIESVNAYREMTANGTSPSDMMRYINLKGRDNARTPMQWTGGKNAGFTTGTPWLAVNPNYKEINAEKECNDPDSVFNYYKKLILLRKTNPVVTYGKFELLLPDDKNLFVYTRTLNTTRLLVICNYCAEQIAFEIGQEWQGASLLISNYSRGTAPGPGIYKLRSYEAIALIVN